MGRRHWDVLSEQYTGADSLVTFLEDGWVMNKLIRQEEYRRCGRLVTVYHFELQHEGETVEMAVVGNPYVSRLVAQSYTQAVLVAL